MTHLSRKQPEDPQTPEVPEESEHAGGTGTARAKVPDHDGKFEEDHDRAEWRCASSDAR